MIVEKIDLEKTILETLKARQYTTLVELRRILKEKGICISYSKLKEVVNDMLKNGKIRSFKYDKKILYFTTEN